MVSRYVAFKPLNLFLLRAVPSRDWLEIEVA
jgi:hypothetical protein